MLGKRSKLLAYATLSWPPHTLAYVVAPLIVSRFGRRHGWTDGRPGPLNVAGLPFLVAGAALIAWAISTHYRVSPEEVQFRAAPNYLAIEGAYGLTRNPLYLGGGTLWTGWALLLGSVPVAAVGTVLFGLLNAFGIPFEERMLTDRFGDSYTAYRKQVPRWIGRRGRSPENLA